MSESPEVADDPPAVKALRERRQKARNQLSNANHQLRLEQSALNSRQHQVDRLEAEIADIDRALQALSYPD